ncbi:MAG: hypothetical protein ACT4PT_13720 [Methanobacteriota archaeon]
MPYLKPGSAPVPPARIKEALRDLAKPHRAKVMEIEDRRCMVVRAEKELPDPFTDVERASHFLCHASLDGVSDVFVASERKILRIDPRVVAQQVSYRVRENAQIAAELRQIMAREHGAHSFHHPITNAKCVGVRVPRLRAEGTLPADAATLVEKLGEPEVRVAEGIYVIADEDHLRLSSDEFLALLPAAREREAGSREPGAPEPAIALPTAPAPTEPAPGEPRTAPEPLEAFGERLAASGYRVSRAVTVGTFDFEMAGLKVGGKRVLVKAAPDVTLELARSLQAAATDALADVCIVVTPKASAEVLHYSLGTRLELFAPQDLAGVPL